MKGEIQEKMNTVFQILSWLILDSTNLIQLFSVTLYSILVEIKAPERSPTHQPVWLRLARLAAGASAPPAPSSPRDCRGKSAGTAASSKGRLL